MALVGPRPHPAELDARYLEHLPHLSKRYSVLPGMTGLAQVHGCRGPIRCADDMRRRVELDLRYVTERTWTMDIQILIKTLFGGFICPAEARSGKPAGRTRSLG